LENSLVFSQVENSFVKSGVLIFVNIFFAQNMATAALAVGPVGKLTVWALGETDEPKKYEHNDASLLATF
jgi:hypothetical protein